MNKLTAVAALLSSALQQPLLPFLLSGQPQHDPVCVKIGTSISSASAVYYAGDEAYTQGNSHWASSSTQNSNCVVEPGSASDIAIILGIIGEHKTPFAVKGGGHTSNPGFSSTTGVQIWMRRFSEVNYDAQSQTVEFGAGLLWDDVYAALDPHNVTVVGGRVSHVGVAGFILGGGYSWLTNQYGLTVDTVTAFELVKPTGKVEIVTQQSDPTLFSGLKGGLNNFGIVTKFTLKTFPSNGVWGGLMLVNAENASKAAAAVKEFCGSFKDPKASIIANYATLLGDNMMTMILFYDAPTPPPGIFDALLAVPTFGRDVESRNMTSLVTSIPNVADYRGAFHSVPLLDFSPSLLKIIENENALRGSQLKDKGSYFTSYAIEPFVSGIYTHNPDKTAFPPDRSQNYFPLNLYFSWTPSEYDADFIAALKATGDVIRNAAVSQGQNVSNAPIYPNYALPDTPLSQMYGVNLPELQKIKATVDPNNVMGLAGGFRF